MKSKIINILGTCYVAFAVIVAYQALDKIETSRPGNPDQGVQLSETEYPLSDYQRLDRPRKKADKSEYLVEVWTSEYCGPCKQYKIKEVPAILKLGYKLSILDIEATKPPKGVTSVPTVCLYHKGNLLEMKVGWTAKDIDKYVEDRLSLKEIK